MIPVVRPCDHFSRAGRTVAMFALDYQDGAPPEALLCFAAPNGFRLSEHFPNFPGVRDMPTPLERATAAYSTACEYIARFSDTTLELVERALEDAQRDGRVMAHALSTVEKGGSR